MNELTYTSTDGGGPVAVLVAAVGVLLAGVVTAWFGVPPEYLVAVLVGPALLVGPRVAWGAGIGVFLGDLGSGVVGSWTVLLAVWTVGVPYAAAVLWDGDHAGWQSPRTVWSYVVALVVAAVCTLAVVAWLASLLGAAPYLAGLWTYLIGAALAVPVGLASLVGFDYLLVDRAGTEARLSADGGTTGGRLGTAGLFLVGTGWLALGTGIATLTHDVRVLESRPAVVDYATGLVGSGTAGDVATTVLLSLYEVGDLVVALVGLGCLLAMAALWPTLRWASLGRRVRSTADRLARALPVVRTRN